MSHKAVVVTEIGKPLVETTRTTPKPGPGEVLLKVAVVGINPHDYYAARYGLFIKDTLPSPVGDDIVSTVTALGATAGSAKFKVGDRIMGFGNPAQPDFNGTQELMLLKTRDTSLIPPNLSDDEAATLPLNVFTSAIGLFSPNALGFPAPFAGSEPTDLSKEIVVIIGGGAATGKFAIQLAKMAGIGNIIAIASATSGRRALELGATYVVDRAGTETEVVERVRAIVGDDCLHVLDCVGGAGGGQTLGVRILSRKKRGTVSVLIHGGTVDESRVEPKSDGYELKKLLANGDMEPSIAGPVFNSLTKWAADGTVLPTTWQVVHGCSAENVNKVLDGFEGGKWPLKSHIHHL